MGGQYLLATLGCKVNQYESQLLRGVLETAGLRPADRPDTHTLAVVNTCAVTATASRKSRQIIRRLSNGGRIPVVVVGCGASAEPERIREIPGVAAVFGHDVDVCRELQEFLTQGPGSLLLAGNGATNVDRPDEQKNEGCIRPGNTSGVRRTQTAHSDHNYALPIVKKEHEFAERIDAFPGHQRAFVKVQDGCDAFCTYCIIPRLRPGVRFKPPETVAQEVRTLVRSGHKEVILTGIFLGAYARQTALRKRWDARSTPLADLIRLLAGIEGLERLRLSSLEPGDVNDSLLEVLGSDNPCVPHLHLPLQSGSPNVLRRMNRQYSVDDFVDMVSRVRSALDRPAITTDIIAGFPGETDDDFEATLELARHSRFCKIHSFPFSPRDGTAAAKWSGDFVHPSVIRERMKRLADVERSLSYAYRSEFVGKTERVIVEQSGKNEESVESLGDGMFQFAITPIAHGRSDRYFEIHFDPMGARPGDVIHVKIDRVTPTRTHGTCIEADPTCVSLPVISQVGTVV